MICFFFLCRFYQITINLYNKHISFEILTEKIRVLNKFIYYSYNATTLLNNIEIQNYYWNIIYYL